MKIQPFGDTALLITFEKVIEEEVNQKVINLYRSLKGKKGFDYLIPAYNSLTIGIDKSIWTLQEAILEVNKTQEAAQQTSLQESHNSFVIPVCYERAFAPDIEEVSIKTGLSAEQIVQLHTALTYRVYMLGFVAGFAYMGSLPEALTCSRKETPRSLVPEGAVGLAGRQTGIYPTEAPGGWQIVGKTPLKMFDAQRTETSLLKPGDEVRFRAIGADEFKIIQLKIETGIFEMEVPHE